MQSQRLHNGGSVDSAVRAGCLNALVVLVGDLFMRRCDQDVMSTRLHKFAGRLLSATRATEGNCSQLRLPPFYSTSPGFGASLFFFEVFPMFLP
jgi:hypothetical protein